MEKAVAIFLMLNILLFGSSLTKQDIKKWKDIGVEKGYISNYKHNHINYNEAKKWFDVDGALGNWGYDGINKWKKAGVKTPEEAKIWVKIGYSLRKRFYSVRLWKAANINAVEAMEWINIGIKKPKEASKWKKAGISVEKAKQWLDAGLNLEDAMNKYSSLEEQIKQKQNYNSLQEQYTGINITDSYDIKKLIKNKISPKEAKEWLDSGVSIGYITDVIKCKELGYDNVSDSIKWKKAKAGCFSNYSTKLDWVKSGITTPEVAAKWYKLGITPREFDFDYLKKHQLSYSTLASWKKETGLDFHKILYLIKQGFSLEEYKDYENMDYELAIQLKGWGIKPNKLIDSMALSNKIWGVEIFFNNKEHFLKAYNALKGNCQEVEHKYFANIDMYYNSGKCSIFVGKLIQRLDKHHGLVKATGGQYIYLDFDGRWREGTSSIGVVKGDEAFSYETQDGSSKSVPKGKVLFKVQ